MVTFDHQSLHFCLTLSVALVCGLGLEDYEDYGLSLGLEDCGIGLGLEDYEDYGLSLGLEDCGLSLGLENYEDYGLSLGLEDCGLGLEDRIIMV